MNKFARYRVWPSNGFEELNGRWCFGRTAQEAGEEAFLDFISFDNPPKVIELHCRRDGGAIETVRVEPAFTSPFLATEPQPAFQFS